ncbi:MAG: hypothetical protein HOD11_08050, partial [Candidatus Marinimicrobia bacterium]|nr:hypothetical protein [Candidatus Neomarinimicrobiota bacterium]
HDGRYSASIWMAINPDGRRIIFDEYPRSKKSPFWKMHGKRTTSEEVRDWIAMENLHPFIQPKGRNVGRVLDKRFGWQTRGDTNFATLYAKAGKKADYPFNFKESYSISGAETEIQYGHRMVREAFRDMPVPNDPNIEPGLIIWNTCYHTWNGLSHYIRKMEVTKAAADKAVGTGIIVEKYKDFPDVIRYGVCTSTPPPRQTFQQREQERVLDEVFNTKKKVARW